MICHNPIGLSLPMVHAFTIDNYVSDLPAVLYPRYRNQTYSRIHICGIPPSVIKTRWDLKGEDYNENSGDSVKGSYNKGKAKPTTKMCGSVNLVRRLQHLSD